MKRRIHSGLDAPMVAVDHYALLHPIALGLARGVCRGMGCRLARLVKFQQRLTLFVVAFQTMIISPDHKIALSACAHFESHKHLSAQP